MQGPAQQALQSAQESYTPYTRCPAGMALVTGDSSVYRGGVIESCAYNPTINPLQAACITLAAKGRGAFSQVHDLSCAVECYAFRSFPWKVYQSCLYISLTELMTSLALRYKVVKSHD